jgi:hypothetical protein
MIPSLPLAFAQPLLLLGLLSLPILFWLLRLVPPRPRRIEFPPARLLFDIVPKEETPARTPWWLTLLRLSLAALVIFAAAGPLWNPPVAGIDRTAPLAILIDDGYAAAATWDARLRTADEMIGRAEADNRGVAVFALSETARDISLQPPGAARIRLKQLRPQPYALDRMAALPPLERFLNATPDAELVWMMDGLDYGRGDEFVAALKKTTERRALTLVSGGIAPPLALAAADNTASGLTVKVLRGATGGAGEGIVRAIDLKGLPLGDTAYSFKSGERETDATFDLPVEIRNDVARIEIASERSAGAVQLLDKRWRRRTIGVISGSSSDTAQPLLGSTFYLSRALNPFADVRVLDAGSPAEGVTRFLDQRLPLLVLADVGKVTGDANGRLSSWIDNGGVLVRFAGPRLAAASDDDLVPVKLRRGGRILGGALSWEQPQQMAAFSREGPFAGMPVPNDVTVTRQVLAEPDAELNDRTWATLADGTPLVTAQKRGKGLVVLFHVTSDTRWSDLPLSGAFVDMLKRLVALAGSSPASDSEQTAARQAIPASRTLDGFGAFEPPPPTARPVPAGYNSRATADHPPGFYGPPEGLVAVNTLAAADRLTPLDTSALTNALREPYRLAEPQDLRGPIFLLALALLLIDGLVVLFLAGGWARITRRRAVAASAALLFAVIFAMSPQSLHAQTSVQNQQSTLADEFALKSSIQTRLAYIVTGDASTDAVSKSGLQGLTLFLAQRTALEAGDPVGVDPARDELSFFPVIYWPIVPGTPRPSAQALSRVDAYMKQGGTVVFDTRDAGTTVPNDPSSPGTAALRDILAALDIPELEPLPRDHVLTKTFFLMKDFPGRFTDGQMWVEALPANTDGDENSRPARGGDGVSSILITSNDLAGAWAVRPDGQPMLPLSPGEPRQREFAFRAGVNIVMYALTGNYKADQVHIPALLERLGQ